MTITKCFKAAAGGFLLLIMSLLSSASGFGQGMKREDFFLKPLTSGGVGAVSGAESVCVGAGLATTPPEQ